MNLDKLVYQVREELGAISDDRRIDRRYIINAINVARAGYLRKLVTRSPGYNTNGLTQDLELTMQLVSRSEAPDTCPLNCTILRSEIIIPELVYYGTLGNWWSIKSVDVQHRWFELIEQARAGYVTFEFNVGYGFISSTDYLYMMFRDSKDLKCVIISGIFADPLEVDPDLTDYPINSDGWDAIKPLVLDSIRTKIGPDPLNNSEEDYGTNRRASKRDS